MGLINDVMEAIIAIIIIFVFFFNVLPELAKTLGFSVFFVYIIGFLLLAVVILSLLKR